MVGGFCTGFLDSLLKGVIMSTLSNTKKVAIVTGASGDIGMAIAKLLAKPPCGEEFQIVGFTRNGCKVVVEEITQAGGRPFR